jgi:hypothetical protein
MATERQRQLVLAALALVLGFVVYKNWPGTTSAEAPPPSNQRAATAAAPSAVQGRGAPPGTEAPDVHLEALNAERPKPEGPDRNLFRFKPPPAPPPVRPVAPPPGPPPPPPGPPPPPPVPPITLKFIGVLEPGGDKPKIAVLSDGTGGPPVYGREGETVLGRYRILKIGVESIEMAYLDGRGRQTIRLTGS